MSKSKNLEHSKVAQLKTPDPVEIDKSKAYITIEIIEYLQNAVVIKTILKK